MRLILRTLAASLALPRSATLRSAPVLDMDVAFLVFLILLNGAFAMSEMALTASRKARLQVMLEAGDRGAQAAIDLHDNPTKFLSTVQIGITSIGILNGIVGEAAFAEPLADWLQQTFQHATSARRTISATGLVVVDHHLPDDHLRRAGAQAPRADVPGDRRAAGRAADGVAVADRAAVRQAADRSATEARCRLLGIRGGPSRA